LRSRGITVQDQFRQKVHEAPTSTNGWAWWFTPVIPATRGSTNGNVVQTNLGIKQDLISKVTKAGGDMVKW
jgi:hypothetical protein